MTPSDFSKLTVPQLKALCKERRITGYSKLSKAALLQKLAEIGVPAKTTTPSNDRANQSTTSSATEAWNTANTSPSIESSTASVTTAAHQLAQSSSLGNTESTETLTEKTPLPTSTELAKSSKKHTIASTQSTRKTSGTKQPAHTDTPLKRIRSSRSGTESTETTIAKDILPIEPARSSQNRTVTSTANTPKTSGTKRPAHIDVPAAPKRIRTTLTSATTAGHEPPLPRIFTLQHLPVDSSVFKIPELPASSKRVPHSSASTLAKPPFGTSKPPAPRQSTSSSGRFKPVVVISRTKPVGPAHKEPSQAQTVLDIPSAGNSSLASIIHTTPLPVLSHISLPPKASERKWVYRWATILSGLSTKDRRTCMLVSRTFRYAVYLSAIHILSANYAGRRLHVVLEQHPRNMTNFWPYLRFRMAEVSERRTVFKQSFLGRYTHSIGYDPLSQHLWTSPDDKKQVDIAIRFVLTRMWFAVSVGAYGHDASTWTRCLIRDAREVVKGEIWQVIARDDGTGGSCSFYVLEATCEVIGQPPSSQAENSLGYCLRADWSTWISQRSRAPLDARPYSLLECVKWSNTEDYYRGISKAWLRRIQGQDVDSVAKRIVAERYILASVVANGISGRWMSTSAMAQEFAGFPGNDAPGRTAGRTVNTVNMYLPAHHHIESIHFTTSKREVLHGAVAIVQTPGREYYVLRDNGMQVGCEEEGIPEVWQQILGCDGFGRAR